MLGGKKGLDLPVEEKQDLASGLVGGVEVNIAATLIPEISKPEPRTLNDSVIS